MGKRIPSRFVIQADSLGKVIDMLELIAEGPMTDAEIADSLGMDKRQGAYYRSAAEAIALAEHRDGKTELSKLGWILVNKLTDRPDQKSFLRVVVLVNPLLRRVVDDLESAGEDGMRTSQIRRRITEYSDLSDETIDRRTKSVVQWLIFLKLARMEGDVLVLDGPLLDLKPK